MSQTLIEQLEAAKTKGALEALGKEHLGINADKRQGIETIRAELLELAEAPTPGDAPQEPAPATNEAEPATATGEQDEPTEYQGRMLKHIKSGRLFPWTADLAKNRYLKEV